MPTTEASQAVDLRLARPLRGLRPELSTRSSSSGCATSRTSSAGRPGSCGRTGRLGLRTARCRRCSRETAGTASARCERGAHSTTVDGAAATFPSGRRRATRIRSWAFTAAANEDARFRAGVYRLRKGRRPVRVLTEPGRIEAHGTRSCASRPPPRPGPVRLLDPPQSRSKPRPQDPPHEPPLRRPSRPATSGARHQTGPVTPDEAWRAASTSLAMTT